MTYSLAPTKFIILRDDLQNVLSHTRSTWKQLHGQRIFVTGGTGFFGKWLLESFAFANSELELGAEVVALTRHRQRFLDELPHLAERDDIRFHDGDVRTFDFPGGEFDFIIHAATDASATLNENDPRAMFDVIAGGTKRVLDFAERSKARRLLLTSSGAVYGKQPRGMIHVAEDYLGAPDAFSRTAAYGEGKRVAEWLCGDAHFRTGLEVVIARCFAFVGPFLPLDQHFAVGNFLNDALRGRPIVVNGTGRDLRSYMYAADLAIWLWSILVNGRSCHPYNVGSDTAMSIAEVAQSIAKLASCEVDVRSKSQAAPDSVSCYVPSTERAREELGLSMTTNYQTAIERTFNWYRERRRSAEK
ncbi:MAG TPA: NAD-dependent epimerase/dehydratase family protein [Lacipirellulaceae bacterium]|nr:NAD-dependent epimerase/dehydratase family protein [Lacipirellulaceae bacterium]